MINFTKTDIDKIKIVFNEFKELQCFDYEIYQLQSFLKPRLNFFRN